MVPLLSQSMAYLIWSPSESVEVIVTVYGVPTTHCVGPETLAAVTVGAEGAEPFGFTTVTVHERVCAGTSRVYGPFALAPGQMYQPRPPPALYQLPAGY